MIALHPCPSCRRHVRGANCPFCGGTAVEKTPIDLGLGRLSRAMVFASAALTVGACGGTHKPAADEMGEQRHPGGGGCLPPDEAKIKELEAQKAAAKTDEEKAEIEERLRYARQPQCMPYGAPPARRRIV